MTTEEMTEKIIEFVQGYQPASLVELIRYLGEEAQGEMMMHLPNRPNIILWMGVSDAFINAFIAAKREVFLDTTHFMIYAMDGGVLRLPIAKRFGKTDYKKPHWLPVVLSIKRDKEKAA